MSKKPVVLYGASGYTGRLAAEYLREFNIPFVAAGRNAESIKNVMAHVPGVEAALAAGCHYIDTTGEQDWMRLADQEYGERYAAKGLLISPAVAHMYVV